MKLKPYLDKMGLSKSDFAEASSIPLPTVYRLIDEPWRTPDGETIAKVVRATNGQVGLFDLVENGKPSAA